MEIFDYLLLFPLLQTKHQYIAAVHCYMHQFHQKKTSNTVKNSGEHTTEPLCPWIQCGLPCYPPAISLAPNKHVAWFLWTVIWTGGELQSNTQWVLDPKQQKKLFISTSKNHVLYFHYQNTQMEIFHPQPPKALRTQSPVSTTWPTKCSVHVDVLGKETMVYLLKIRHVCLK